LEKTYGATTVLRVAEAVLTGEGALPRCMLVGLTRRLAAQGQEADSPQARLAPRERQVLALLSQGWDNTRIGNQLFIS
jgi:DNA-binding NarL/FixJ family response regulator